MKFTGKAVLIMLLCACSCTLWATHYRAGEILYKYTGNLTYTVTVITYTKISSPSNLADRDTVEVTWGDGTTAILPRINGPVSGSGYGSGVLVQTDVQKNEYQGTHKYPGIPPSGFYVLEFYDQNRLDGVQNISGGNSIDVPFYIEDTLYFPHDPTSLGFFSSPILANPAVQYAQTCDTFRTNPEAIDYDGDSIDYSLVACKQDQNALVPYYIFPDNYCRSAAPNCATGLNNTCTINRHTGDFVWADPCVQGIFNVGILMRVYRNGKVIGTVLRDMQIIVQDFRDHPPKLQIPEDTCVRAGDTLIQIIRATDPDAGDRVTISATGVPLLLTISPARFDSVTHVTPVSGTFTWNTTCDHIQLAPYPVYFKAEDDNTAIGPNGQPSPYHMQDFRTWNIRVIPPPVEGLTATSTHTSVLLTWQNPYKCASSPNFRGFTIWRKDGCDHFTPDYCETGLDGRGYTQIASVGPGVYTYTDNSVVPGQAYSYRIVAEFYKLPPNGNIFFQYDNQESVPSDEVCINAPISVPVILNVDVMQTDVTNGRIYVRWAKPLAGGVNLDTLQDTPKYRFDLYRSQSQTFNLAQAVLVNTNVYDSYTGIPDTVSFIDNGINTQDNGWSYRVYFYAKNDNIPVDTIGASAPASSVYLKIQQSDRALILHYNFTVPWTNDSFTVYRQNHVTNIYDSIGIGYTTTYPDTGLINDTLYCYYVKAWGHYSSGIFPQPLLNRSEQQCKVPIDTTAPCPPTLFVTNDCGDYVDQSWYATQFINHLRWSNNPDSCSMDIIHYRIYFNNSDSTNFALIDSLTTRDDTTYQHLLNNSLTGCYAVTAIDKAGNESQFSNLVCVDNCPYYVLPNTFTPNGDGANDLFKPFKPYRFVTKIEMKIFNRWGELVFETNDPEINWDGKDKAGHDVSEGIYLYAGFYYEQHLNGLVKKPLSGEKKGGGFIHLIRGK